MKSRRTGVWVLLGVAYVAATVALWPLYKTHFGPTSNTTDQAALAHSELADVSPTAPLVLLTEPDDGIAPIEQAIAAASSSIDLVMYEMEDTALEQMLVDAHNHGVAVEVLLDNLSSFGKHPNQAAFDFLTSNHVPVKWSPSYFPLTHQKTLVVDGARAYIMTFNFTPQYYAGSRDFAVVDDDPADVGAIESAFGADWSGNEAPAQNGNDLVWSPGSADTMLALINSASTTLDVYNEEMADPRIIGALESAAARGVAVRVDMTYETSWKIPLEQLVAAGVSVRTYASSAKFYIHAKMLVADRTTAFVGSENFSAQSLDQNRELGILITKPDIIASLESTFTSDWSGSRIFTAQGTSLKK